MFGKKRSLPRAIAFVDFEHWYISLERLYSVKPDVKAWADELRSKYDIEEIAIFADFSNPVSCSEALSKRCSSSEGIRLVIKISPS